MRHIDLETWPRRRQYDVFRGWDYPHFNMCANLDLTAFYPAVKERGVSFTVAITYVMARTANAIPEFRYRMRDESVVEHDVVHPATTILTEDEQFTFCQLEYTMDFPAFAAEAIQQIGHMREHPTLENPPGRDDWLYVTAIPWVSFTSFMHPLDLHPADSVPRFAYGRYFAEGERLRMPLSVQGHHALMDGLHVARYYEGIQKLLDNPEQWLSPA